LNASKPVICIISQSHLCRNPRVLKEAVSLAQNGYSVHVLTSIYSTELLEEDKLAIQDSGVNLHIIADNSDGNFQSYFYRTINRTAKLAVKYFHLQTPLALGYAYQRYLKISKGLKANLYICHQELATCVGSELIKQGYKVAFDLEDWYSEDLLPDAQMERPIKLLKEAEKIALNHGAYTTTTSGALANALWQKYGGIKPSVIYNVFPTLALPNIKKAFIAPVKLFWFSQTIGPGRGLEQFMKLLPGIKTPLQLHFLGFVTQAYKALICNMVAPPHEVFFHPLVSENELMAKIAGFDIGLALEAAQPLSRDYTITNKFFQYLQAGLPVIATRTAGQTEGFEKHHPGILIPQHPTNEDIIVLNTWLSEKPALTAAAKKATEASRVYNWERESIKLLKLVADALK
jgi:glycosyltransferase involved in cell wall biosynthesis